MEIIAICNQKGGCAKTTTTINLAASLAGFGKRVLVIDNDMQGNLTQSLGIKDYTNTIYECVKDEIAFNEAIINTSFQNIDIVVADLNYSNAEIVLANKKDRENLLSNSINKAKLSYDYILIDCSPSLSLVTINALVAANSILIPLEASLFNLEGVAQLVKILKLVRNKFNPDLAVKGVLLTRVDSRSTLEDLFKDQLRDIFGDKLFNTVIHQNTAIVRSQIEKKPVLLYDKNCKGSKEYLELAKEVINRG
ncbi:cobQ/CobB/MinD/ParA nucleotide binding domain protein [Clostridium argentinense CDC 2741]|uniref:Sporulation initiation inhibitor protein Soj n=2 Tax=Clostridium argentinense TaxID=29341 RepID=A0A0C1TZD2_9CLOT|nr:AAA family ATPase [Clostridium argentinense]ARC83077.1 cobyrinic acid a,c-diamide synthase [Clostridium argentinense]KIE44638.1 cobQ/CobB/MinD/ParA nucleotide binding domain protein [Clostridium argentinense CDC 2741]NFF41438.1 ParA family protein [Clostridium argentinense]NFP51734.1 ParA family protein [Clostridium argentinense]NFP74402.1 ParA family protein [Clostridium argentinense]